MLLTHSQIYPWHWVLPERVFVAVRPTCEPSRPKAGGGLSGVSAPAQVVGWVWFEKPLVKIRGPGETGEELVAIARTKHGVFRM